MATNRKLTWSVPDVVASLLSVAIAPVILVFWLLGFYTVVATVAFSLLAVLVALLVFWKRDPREAGTDERQRMLRDKAGNWAGQVLLLGCGLGVMVLLFVTLRHGREELRLEFHWLPIVVYAASILYVLTRSVAFLLLRRVWRSHGKE